MQASTVQPTATPPTQPVNPATPGVTISVPGTGTIRIANPGEAAQLRARGNALSEQLTSAARRRRDVAEQINSADGVARAGLESRLQTLDARIVDLEQQIQENGARMAEIGVSLNGGGDGITGMPPEVAGVVKAAMGPLSIIAATVLLLPMALAATRLMWRRANRQPAHPSLGEATARLQKLEHAVDAVAIEVERISEGQRFITRVLSDPARRAEAMIHSGRAPGE
jgi:hypothetical protein